MSNYIFAGRSSVNVNWDKVRSATQSRCRNCQMHPFYMAALDDRPFTEDCPECQGTNREPMPWTELFITSPYRRRD